MMDAAQIIKNLSRRTDGSHSSITVTRDAGGAYGPDGIWVPNPPTVFTANAAVQSLNGEELKLLAEGQRERDPRVVFCATELTSGDANATPALKPDKVSFDGRSYEVVSVIPNLEIARYYEAVMLRLGN